MNQPDLVGFCQHFLKKSFFFEIKSLSKLKIQNQFEQ